MPWNWELPDWPKFHYDPASLAQMERQFLLGVGSASAYLKTIEAQEYNRFIVEILSAEGLESSKIEGEISPSNLVPIPITGIKRRCKHKVIVAIIC